MTDEEIVQALRCCAEGECKDCAMHEDKQRCQENLLNKAAEAIESLTAENAALREKVPQWISVEADRLRELAEADKDGRVVVLPCKDWMDIVFGGQTLFWGIDTDYIENPIREISVDGAERIGWYVGWKTVFLKGTDENGETWEFSPDEIGKTVFLSREEAKRALEGRKDD